MASIQETISGPEASHGPGIGRITPEGAVTEFALPTPDSNPTSIVTGPDGNLWFTEFASNRIGRITPAGVITEFATPRSPSRPSGITVGPDGNLWFTQAAGSANSIQAISSSPLAPREESGLPLAEREGYFFGADGVFLEEAPLATQQASPAQIVAGPDGNLWATELTGNKIAVVHLDPGRRFVQALYRHALGRRSSHGEEDFWLGTLVSGGVEPVVAGIERSVEAQTRRVQSWYATYLGRPQDITGQGFFVATLQAGTTTERALSILLGSNEYFALHGSSPTDELYVRALYGDLLARTPSSAEVGLWLDRLTTLGRDGVALGIVTSAEYREQVVARDYDELLLRTRPPTKEEVDGWATSTRDLLTKRIGIESSQEFFVQGRPDGRQCFIQSLYQDALGRSAANQEQDYWLTVFLDGGLGPVASGIARSPEAHAQMVKSWYRTYLGREADAGGERLFREALASGATEEQTLAILLASQEYMTVTGSGAAVDSYVRALYAELLQRTPSAEDVQFWVDRLGSLSREAVAQAFLGSVEYRRNTVRSAYAESLRRRTTPTAAAVDWWALGRMDLATIRVGLQASVEYYMNS